ncbi:glycosyl transferase [Skermanella stibiiresistens SB22]|uniref:Glycosyl transferase n=1 Tax=Skermanella stibiiresistens SB22 TaxID=1385369 RepID=W9H9Q7_9PROT|nr:WecB/TagA/CpsF family glycosyltransferase [Skermanella stibiiresistens]EWY41442.1 glycosyl transferase [Skermanella stibiiresistens SB22]
MPLGFKSNDIFGVKVTPTTMDDLFTLMDRSIAADDKVVIASLNLHGMYKLFKDDVFRALHDDDKTCVHIDGMPIVWLGRAAGLDLDARHRTGWIDWFLPLMERAQRSGWRIYYLGGTAQVLADGLARLRREYPDLAIDGHDGYFDATPGSAENAAVVAHINAFRPNMLIVGMGMGRQEHWISENRASLRTNCIGTCGACMEYFAGAVPTAPRWLGPLGLEWLYRLLSDPKRFWHRYLVEPWIVAWLLMTGAGRRRAARSQR